MSDQSGRPPRQDSAAADSAGTGAFLEATFEDRESEFLQMGMYVILTVFLVLVGASVYLRERGSPESKPVAEPHYETGA
ncbi:MAG TPA: DUF6766 family protein [Arthrobacter sp.]